MIRIVPRNHQPIAELQTQIPSRFTAIQPQKTSIPTRSKNSVTKPNKPMKNTKSILLAVLAAAAVGSASAQTIKPGIVINVAGSTAMRSISMPALDTYATGLGYTRVAADNASTASHGIALYIKDTRNVANTLITRDAINVRLVGSEGGLLTTAGTKPANRQTFLPVIGTNSWNSASATSNVRALVSATDCTVPGFAAVTFADQSQDVSAYNSATTARVKVAKLPAGIPLAALNFAFFANTNFPVSNITTQVAKALLEKGNLPLSFFTGNPADTNTGVWITGRDIDSGTRAVTLLETGYGINKAVKQYMVDTNNNVIISPTNSLLGTLVAQGNNGYSSGGTMRSAVTNNSLNFSGVNTPGYTTNYLIGYAGTPDVISAKAKALSFNGVQPYCPSSDVSTAQGFSTSTNGLANGSYSFWSIAYLYSNPTKVTTPAAKAAVAALVANIGPAIQTATSAQLKNGNTKLSDLKVQRANGVGSTIVP